MESAEFGHFRDPQAHILPEQVHGIHNPVIVDILPEVLAGETVDGFAQVVFIGKDGIGQILEVKGLNQEGPKLRHIPAAPVAASS